MSSKVEGKAAKGKAAAPASSTPPEMMYRQPILMINDSNDERPSFTETFEMRVKDEPRSHRPSPDDEAFKRQGRAAIKQEPSSGSLGAPSTVPRPTSGEG